MKKQSALIFAFVAILTAVGCATDGSELNSYARPAFPEEWNEDEQEVNADAAATLDEVISIDVDNITLDDLIDFVRASTGANIAVNWPALELVGIDEDALVSVRLQEVRASALLQLTLDQVSADSFEEDKAGYIFRDGIVLISTRRELMSETVTRVYDVRWYFHQHPAMYDWLYADYEGVSELIAILDENDRQLLDEAQVPMFDLNDAVSSVSYTRPEPVEQDDYDNPQAPVPLDTSSQQGRVDQLREWIETTSGYSDGWVDGQFTLTELNGHLVIRATPEVHRKVLALLEHLPEDEINRLAERARLIEVMVLLRRAEGYRLQQDYSRALRLVEQALRVDPNNPEARALERVLRATLSR